MFFQKDNTGQSNPPVLVICSVPIPTNCSYAAALKMRFYMISKKDPYEQHNVAHLSEYQEILKEFQAALSDFVLFHSLGKVHCDPSAPQLRDQEVLNRQADELKAFIRSQW